jgi:2-dehydropantoate 2-reductase
LSARICIFGAGAIGGFLAARFARAGYAVSCIARGDHLAAIRARGLHLIEAGQDSFVQIECTDRPDSLGQQDFVFVTLKTHAVAGSVEGIAALLGPSTGAKWPALVVFLSRCLSACWPATRSS